MTEKQEKIKNAPVYKARAGTLEVSAWENEVKKGENSFTSYNVTFKRGYKDKNGDWNDTQSLNVSDIPKLRELLRECFAWIITKKKESEE